MSDGLNIDARVFQSLPQKQQLLALYNNTEELKSLVLGYKFNQKMQYAWLAVLTIALGLTKYLGVL